MHLLLTECFETFRAHLAPGGILVFRLSSRYLDLGPVVAGLAERFGLSAGIVISPSDGRIGAYQSQWVLVTNNQAFLKDPDVQDVFAPASQVVSKTVLWTDDFSSLLQVVK